MDVHRFFLAIPLLFIGVFMTIDPIGFVRVLNDATVAIHRFGEELRFGWKAMPIGQLPARPSTGSGVRFAGIALTGVAISFLVTAVLQGA